MAEPAPRIEVMRSVLGRARGLGAAKSGGAVWWTERMTSLALLPLTVWFVWFALHLAGAPRAAVAASVAHPVNATLLLAVVLVSFRHIHLGLAAVIEDYARATVRAVLLILVDGACALLALAGGISVLKLALG
jgi:succinate dehydrogenase / fumarate reductase membrane anchor subunit